MIDTPPPAGPPLSDAQRQQLESLFEVGAAQFRDLEARYEAHLAVMGREMERLAALGLDHRRYVIQELDQWAGLLSSAVRRLDMSAAMSGRDAAAVTERTIDRVLSFAETVKRQAQDAYKQQQTDERASAVEFARARAKGLAELAEHLNRIRDKRR